MEGIKIAAQNKKAYYDYFIEETFEAGIVLSGTEVKSVRAGKVNMRDSYASVRNQEVFVTGLHISPYEKGGIFNKDPDRERKLLLHKSEIQRLIGKIQQKGYALIPTKLYFRRNRVKIEIATAKGKKQYDKRQDIAERDAKRNIDNKMKQYNR